MKLALTSSVILLLILLNGCAGMVNRDKMSRLQSSITAYGQAMRWARYQNAHDLHLGKDGFKPKLILEKYDGINVTAYNIIQDVSLNEEQTEADVTAEISYYSDKYGTVDKIRHPQHWWFDEEIKRWFLDANMPEFK